MSLSVNSSLLNARKYAKNGDLEKAEAAYREIIVKFPKNKRAIQAYRNFKLSVNHRTPLGSEPPFEKIQELIRLYTSSQFGAVLLNIDLLRRLFPKSMKLLNLQGAALLGLKNADAAISIYKQVLAIHPKHSDAINNLGNAYQIKGDLFAAGESYKKAISINSKNCEAHYNMGLILHKRGDLNAAIDSFQNAVEIKSDYFEAYNNLGNAFEDRGDLVQAIGAYHKALSIKPDSIPACQNIAKRPTGFLSEEIIVKVEASLFKVLNNTEDSDKFKFLKANLLRHKGNTKEAFNIFREANKIKAESFKQNQDLEVRFRADLLKELKRLNPQKRLSVIDRVKTVFILGASKSGKSTLEKAVGHAPKVHSFFECLREDSPIYFQKKHLNRDANSTHRLRNLQISELFYGDENHLKLGGIEVVTCSNPFVINSIKTLVDGLPNAYFVFVSRDQIDIAADIFTTEYNSSNYFAYEPTSIMHYIEWYETAWNILKAKLPERTLTVEFNDLIQKPKNMVEQLELFLETDMQSANYGETTSTLPSHSEFRGHFQNLLTHVNRKVA